MEPTTPLAAAVAPTTALSTSQPYASAIILSIISLLLALFILPPMLWHASNRNIGATSLILWLLILNLQDFVNALLWSHDNIPSWFSGHVLCDVEVKIMVAAYVGVPASVACVLKALARVMDTERASLGLSKGQRRKGYAVDLLWCVGFPALQMVFHYIVQTSRYYIIGIAGCLPAVSDSWATDVLIVAPPVIWALVGGYYAALVLIRLHRYRRNFTTLLANSNTNKSRFVRLFAICLIWLAISIPLQAYVISQQVGTRHVPFRWSVIHDSAAWQNINKIPSGGTIVYTRYIWLGSAFVVFIFFGFGQDASRMYAKGLQAVGLGRCLTCFSRSSSSAPRAARNASLSGTVSSVSSKAKLIFRRKGDGGAQSSSSWACESRSSKVTTSSMTEPLSPKTMCHPEFREERFAARGSATDGSVGSAFTSHLPTWLGGRSQKPAHDLEKGTVMPPKQTYGNRFAAPFRNMPLSGHDDLEQVPMNNILKTQNVMVHSSVAGGPASPETLLKAYGGAKNGVLVRKEVRQGSEVAP